MLELKKYDINNENFDHWFNKVYFSANAEMKSKIPEPILRTINTKPKDPSFKLTHLQKVYILVFCFGYKMFNVFCGQEGMDEKIFSDLTKKSNSSKSGNIKILEQMDDMGTFVIGGVSLAKSLTYAEHIQTSDIYTLINDAKVTKTFSTRKYAQSRKSAVGLVNFIKRYESGIKNILKIHNLTPADWNCLIYHYEGEKHGKDFITVAFPAYNKNSHHLRKANYKMTNLGYLAHRGNVKALIHRLTATGIDLVDRVMDDILKKL